jgi:hypothetical protein
VTRKSKKDGDNEETYDVIFVPPREGNNESYLVDMNKYIIIYIIYNILILYYII